LLAAKLAGTEGRVLAFEPDPTNYKILKRNVEVNNCSHIIRPIQKAVGAKHGTVAVFIYKDSNLHGIYCHPHAAIKETIEVECVSIDEFLGKQPVDVIKIDIEGNEPYALEGMKETISKSNNLVLFTELAPMFLCLAGVRPEDYLAQLEELGFDVKIIDEHARCLQPVTQDFIAKDDPSCHVNLYCVKRNLRKL
jgi:FkbM family methyltransferase